MTTAGGTISPFVTELPTVTVLLMSEKLAVGHAGSVCGENINTLAAPITPVSPTTVTVNVWPTNRDADDTVTEVILFELVLLVSKLVTEKDPVAAAPASVAVDGTLV